MIECGLPLNGNKVRILQAREGVYPVTAGQCVPAHVSIAAET